MGTGASLLALPDGTTWPDGDLRDGMASCVESLTELQAKLVSAGAWTAEERKAVSDELERSRGVYSKLIDEAPAHREEMQKLRGTLLTKFSNVYVSVYENLVKTEDGFAEFNAQAALCASKAPQEKPRQTTPQLEQLYETGAVSAREPFKSHLDAAGDKLADAKIEMAPLKKMTRTVEKSMLRPDAARRGEVDDIMDVVRGMVICGSMHELGVALAFFAEPDCGWKIVRVKNRFAAPTSGGWADCLLNIVRSDDPHQHVCEVQLVHQHMLLLRKKLGGHDAYNQYRRADELLLVLSGGKDVFAPVHRAVGMLKGLGVVTPRTPVGVCIGAGACAPHRSRSANNTTQAALKTAYSGVSNRLGGATPSLIVAAYTCTHEAKQVAEGLRELVPDTPFVGMSSCQGVVANGFWCSSKKTAPGNQTALGLWAIRDDGGDYQIIHIPDSALGDDPDDLTTRQLAQQVVADRVAAATTGRRTPSFVLCFSAFGFSEAVLEGVKDAVDDGVPVFGGTAADNDVTDKWSLFSSEGGVSQKGVVLVLGRSSVEVACCMTSGFKPTERKGVATKVDGYWLKEIDHEPALTVYDKWTNSESMVGLTTNSSGTTLIKDASSWQPLGVPLDDADKEFRVLHPMKADSAAGSLKLAGSVTEGTNLTLLKGDADSLVDHLLESCERIEVEAKECLGAFMILCGGLVMAMEEEIKEVYEKLADVGGKRASLGMCAFGEQGPNCNRESMHGNLMFGVLMFSNKPVRPTR